MPHDAFGCTGIPDQLDLVDISGNLIDVLNWDSGTTWYGTLNIGGPYYKLSGISGSTVLFIDQYGWFGGETGTWSCSGSPYHLQVVHDGITYRVVPHSGGGGPETYTASAALTVSKVLLAASATFTPESTTTENIPIAGRKPNGTTISSPLLVQMATLQRRF